MTKDEALRIALEALDWCIAEINRDSPSVINANKAITAIKVALEAKDEPVEFFDWYDNAHWGNEDFKDGCHRAWNAAIKYTTPPQRTWVGLTYDEIAEVEDEYIVDYRIPAGSAWNFAKDIEAKLKEKNT